MIDFLNALAILSLHCNRWVADDHLSIYIWSRLVLQAKDILAEKMNTWEDKCADISDVPESVMTMIEGLRTPVSMTPQASPALKRHSRVYTLHDNDTFYSVHPKVTREYNGAPFFEQSGVKSLIQGTARWN